MHLSTIKNKTEKSMTELEQEKQLALQPQSCMTTKTHVTPAPSPCSPTYLASLALFMLCCACMDISLHLYSTTVWTPLTRENIVYSSLRGQDLDY